MVASDQTSFYASKLSGRTWASVVSGDGDGNEVGALSFVNDFDTSSQSLAGKSECCDVDRADDLEGERIGVEEAVKEIEEDSVGKFENVSVDVVDENLVSYETEKDEIEVRESENEVKGLEEAVKKITEDGVGKFEFVSVDVEEKEVVDETLVSYVIEKEEIGDRESENEVKGVEEVVSEDGTKEEKCWFSDKVDDEDNIDQVVEEEAVKLRNFIVDLLTTESLHVDVVDKTPLNNQETIYTREISAEDMEIESSREGVVGVDGSESDEETEGMILGSSKSGEQFLEELEKVSSGIQAQSDETNIPNHHVDRIDGQIFTDSDEEVDTNDDGKEKTFDSAALAAFLKAATSGSSDGGNCSISQDVMKLFSMEHPAGLGSSLRFVQSAAPLPNHSNIFPSLKVQMGGESENNLSEEEKHKLEKLQSMRVKYLRLVHRLGQSVETSIAAQVLYDLAFLTLRHSGQSFSLDAAKKMAMDSEAKGKDLNFSLNILVLGKSGVGKSATINSILGDQKASIHAFQPSTTSVLEISGTVDGVKITIIDTPGLKSSAMDQSANSKMLSSVKKIMKKCPPDVVLYVDRLDAQNRGLDNMPLLRTITASLGTSILKNAIVVLTHAGCAPPDGPYGTPLSYDVFVEQCSHIVQQSIGHAVGDLRLINPRLLNEVSLVENHSLCRKNRKGVKVLPNGQTWRLQLLLLCYSKKVISDARSLLKPPEALDHRKLFGFQVPALPLPNLLSWLLQSRAHPKLPADQSGDSVDSDIEIDVSDSEQEDGEDDEYEQLPPFKPLRKTQLAKLSKEQRKAYFDEYDYRVKLLQKKQWREELRRMREIKKNGKKKVTESEYGYPEEEEAPPALAPVVLPDVVLPPSFDSDHSAYRYRCLEPTSKLITKSVLNPQGWDHDCGLDCVIAERSLAIANRFPAAVSVQVTKDKKEFNIHLDSSICAKHGDSGSTMAGLVIEGSEQLMYTLKGETKFKNSRRNEMTLGGLVTFFGGKIPSGLKLEKQIALGKRVVLVGNAGTTRSQGDSAYEGNLEVRLREADFPIGQNQSHMGVSLKKSKDDLTVTANVRHQVSVGRQTKVTAFASLDSKRNGRLTVRTSSSDQLQIAVMALLPLAISIYKRIFGSGDN
ncbi:unnamed protein product [Arabidopsis arenosa]|uniref:AIG1-type G domain-containing protein n=2 Tax=Arabidopsis arenosa TaxID=38785 RepID=A0A8S2AUN6_ARAAE|nr:unnamed protein product [Arabidopsis arenosa]